ncbi:MAG: efflux transporter outer membrane subunit, partial [Candidatus Acidiferrales bacterium]
MALPLGGCTVGPNYVRPTADVPTAYKEAASPGFESAQPSDAFAKGRWWEIYGDAELDSLEDQVTAANQNLKAAQAQFAQARAAVQVARAAYYPTVSGAGSAGRTHQSQNGPLFGASSPVNYNDFQLPIDASWEPDVWGRVRRAVEAARSEAQASAADLAGVDLSLHAELALDYFELRGLDSQKQLLDSTVVSYEKALELTNSRYHGGIASAVDVAQAQTQLETTRAQDEDTDVQRTAFEHAIAVLIGKPPAEFSRVPTPLAAPPPSVPASVPSE